jgi:ABC transporter DrrB family efflux protein
MTAVSDAPAAAATTARPERDFDGAARTARDVAVLTRRNLVHISREPMQLSDVTIQPVLFTLLFVYIFAAGITLPGGGSYKEFAVPGMMALNLTTSATGTAVGLSTDLATGVIDRFRTLPMWRAAVLVGRSICDVLTAALCAGIVALTGLVVGWRTHTGAWSVVAGFAVMLFFSYAVSWAVGCIGLVAKGPESGMSMAFLILFPMAFVSNAMVATQHMPTVLRAIADWNPVSAVTAATRDLFGNPNPSATIHAWPMQHPVAASLLWSSAILAAFAPLAAHLFRRRTVE